jgi:ABC-2 type transport system ATP-binding protein
MIVAEALAKQYGKVTALAGVDLAVPAGTVLGLLGPNGAGKTTVVRILTTLLRPDAGHAIVAGHDVLREPAAVRKLIGLSGQYAAVDEHLTGRENLDMVGRLYHLGGKKSAARAAELLDQFDLSDAADRVTKTYSGGMRRRLDLAASLVARPQVIFLDEPTTGLDPHGRLGMWDVIRELVREGATLLLTTQYLEEADALADDIAIIDTGKVIAHGTADQLKAQVGGERVELVVADRSDLPKAVAALAPLATAEPVVHEDSHMVTIQVSGGTRALAGVVRELDTAGVETQDLALRRPTLDEVFLSLTGHAAEKEES